MAHPSYDYLYRDGSDATLDGHRFIEMLVEAIGLYSLQGLAVSNSSKLHRATKVFQRASEAQIEGRLYVAVAKLAVEHLSIARMISHGGCSIDDVRTQLSHALSGGVVWQDDRDRRSESFQFELFIGSMFWMAGVRPEFHEPDLVVPLLGEPVAVAAKYLFSNKKARKMAIRAVEQIRRSRRRGIVACGLSQFVPAVVAGKPREDAGEPLDFSKVVPLVAEIDKAGEGEQGVIGRIAVVHTAAFQRNGAGYIRRRLDARPYLDTSRDDPIQERLRWRSELRRLQTRWSAAMAEMIEGKTPARASDG